MLLRCGASVNLPGGRNGLTPLMLAAAAAGPKNAVDVELLETLLEYEADVHLEDKRGWNAMKLVRRHRMFAKFQISFIFKFFFNIYSILSGVDR